MTYAIVEYYPDTSGSRPVEIVPLKWINESEKLVQWPPFKVKAAVLSAVKKGELEPSRNWIIYRYQRILGKYDSYTNALVKLKKSEDTSNLESTQEEELSPAGHASSGRRRATRKEKKPQTRESSSESSSSSVAAHVNAPSHPTLTLAGSGGISLPPPPAADDDVLDTYRAGIADDDDPFDSSFFNNLKSSSQDQFTAYPANEATGVVLVNPGDIDGIKKLVEDFSKTTFEYLEKIRADICDLKAQVASLRSTGAGQVLDFSKIPALPICSRESLQNLEKWLATQPNAKLLTEYLGLAGGSKIEKNVRRILSKAVGPPLRKETNLTGKGGKVAFKGLKLLNCVTDAVRLNFEKANDDVIITSISDWFRNAGKPVSAARGVSSQSSSQDSKTGPGTNGEAVQH